MRVLILGEVGLLSRYLVAVTKNCGADFDHLPPEDLGEMPSELDELMDYDAVVISDGPGDEIGTEKMELLKKFVEEGKGLGMIGGWWSFTGTKGNYHETPVEEVLPVNCLEEDDRVNDPNGFKIIKKGDHAILEDLPWEDPPTVCGYNSVEPKDDGEVLLSLRRIESLGEEKVKGVELAEEENPLLVTGDYGEGRSLALTTDLSPHWCGGMVDWGEERVPAEGTEFGGLYLKFGCRILNWLAGEI